MSATFECNGSFHRVKRFLPSHEYTFIMCIDTKLDCHFVLFLYQIKCHRSHCGATFMDLPFKCACGMCAIITFLVIENSESYRAKEKKLARFHALHDHKNVNSYHVYHVT